MLCVTFQPHFVAEKLAYEAYRNCYEYTGTAEDYFYKQFHYRPIFVIPVKTALSAYCQMLVNQVQLGTDMILFTCSDYFELSRDEWNAMRRGDKKRISQIQSPIKETVVTSISNRDVQLIDRIPMYTSDCVYNYLLYVLSGTPYYKLCHYLHEEPLSVTEDKSDALADLIMSDKYKPLTSTREILDPNLLEKLSDDIKQILMR